MLSSWDTVSWKKYSNLDIRPLTSGLCDLTLMTVSRVFQLKILTLLLVDLRFLRPSLALADMLKMKLTMIFKLFVMKWISTKSTRKKYP